LPAYPPACAELATNRVVPIIKANVVFIISILDLSKASLTVVSVHVKTQMKLDTLFM
jgi:hypothetical protein